MTRFLPALSVAAVAVLFGLGIATAEPTLSVLFSSDILLPSDWVHNLLASPGTVRSFELPRVPSLLPDLLTVLGLSLALPWRVALVGYSALSFAALVLLGGAVASRMAGRPFVRCAAAFGALAALALLADMQWDEGLSAWYLILYPVIHSGAVLLAFAALLLAERFVARPRRGVAAGLVALAAVATLSDRLFVACFFAPAVAGALAWQAPAWRAMLRWRTWLPTAALGVAGCAAGIGLDHLLFHTLLLRQPDLGIKLSLQRSRLPALLQDRYLYMAAGCAVLAAVLPALAGAAQTRQGRFWWAASGLGSLALLGALPLVYNDWTSYRYVQPVWWWAVIGLSAALVRAAPRAGPVAALGAAVLATGVASVYRGDLFDLRAAASWHHPAETCLSGLQRQGRVHAVLADYWLARPIAASSDWTLPAAQILPTGKPQFWGNNRLDYAHDAFDALVADHLDPAAVFPRFGPPDDRVTCAGFNFWLYADPGHLRSRLAGTDTRLGGADIPVRFSPADMFSRTGSLPPDGTVPAWPGPDTATFGPFAALRPGRWRLVLRYSLAGTPSAHMWEIRTGRRQPPVAAGTLDAGQDKILSVPFDMPAGRQMELFTFPPPEDRLQLAGLGLCPAATPEPECVRATLGP